MNSQTNRTRRFETYTTAISVLVRQRLDDAFTILLLSLHRYIRICGDQLYDRRPACSSVSISHSAAVRSEAIGVNGVNTAISVRINFENPVFRRNYEFKLTKLFQFAVLASRQYYGYNTRALLTAGKIDFWLIKRTTEDWSYVDVIFVASLDRQSQLFTSTVIHKLPYMATCGLLTALASYCRWNLTWSSIPAASFNDYLIVQIAFFFFF